MIRLTLASLALVLLVVPAAAQAPSRYGIVLYQPPAGWVKQEKDNLLTLSPPEKGVAIVFSPSQPLAGPLDKIADDLLALAKARPQFREEGKRAGGKHIGSGGQWVSVTCSYADPNRAGQFLYEWDVLIGAGGRYVMLTTIFNSVALFNTHAPTLARMVDRISLTTTVVVETGNPPLSRYMLDECNDFLEWLMQTPLTDTQKATVETEVRGYWQKNIRKEIDDFAELLKGRQQLAAMKPTEREVARQVVLDGAIKQWRTDKDSPAAKMMLEIYDNAHKPIAAGSPPLTRQNVDAFAEFLCFAAGQTAGITATPTAEIRDKLAADVAANYATLANEQRQLIAQMPLIWASLRMLWPDMPEAQKTEYINGWKQNPQLVALGGQLSTNSQSKLLELQAKMRAQQATFQTMSNIMRMQHETNMIIIGNMGGNTRYEYRWR